MASRSRILGTLLLVLAVAGLAWWLGSFDAAEAPPALAPPAEACAQVAAPAITSVARAGPAESPRFEVAKTTAPRRAGRLVGLRDDLPWRAPLELRWRGKDAEGSWHEHEQRVACAPDGLFPLDAPAWSGTAPRYELRVRSDDESYLPLDQRRAAEQLGADIVEIEVRPAARIGGSVVDWRHAPVPAARVVAFAHTGDVAQPSQLASCNTSAEGRFQMRCPLAGHLLLVAMPMQEASLSGNRIVSYDGGGILDVGQPRRDLLPAGCLVVSRFGQDCDAPPLVLREPAIVTGQVLFGDGSPVAGAHVAATVSAPTRLRISDACEVALGSGGPALGDASVAAGADGRFRLPASPGATLHLHVYGVPGLELVAAHMQVPWATTCTAPADVVLHLRVRRLELRVAGNGRPVPRAEVRLFAERGHEFRADEHGRAVLLLASDRDHVLEVEAAEYLPKRMEFAATSADAALQVELEEAATRELQIELAAARTVYQAWFEWQDQDQDRIERATLTRGADGRFVARVRPGRYLLTVKPVYRGERGDSYLLANRRELVVAPGTDPEQVRLDIAHGGRIRFEATGSAGEHLAGSVLLFDAGGSSSAPRLVTELAGVRRETGPGQLSDAGPHETAENLVPGRYRVVVDLFGHGRHEQHVEVRERATGEVRISVR